MLVNSFQHYFQFIHKTYGMLRVTWILDGNEQNRYVVTNVIFSSIKYRFPFQDRVEKMQGSYKRSKGNQANSQCIPVYNLAYFKPMNVFTSSDVVDIICSQCQSGELQGK